MFRTVPPAGVPLSFKHIGSTAASFLRGTASAGILDDNIREMFGSKYIVFVNSGRSALFLILRALRKSRGQDKVEVVIPAYTCFSVASSIAKAGLKIRLADIDPETMDYDYPNLEKTNFEKVLAIVSSNLFGLTGDYDRLNSVARENGVAVIDDAAQSMGLSHNEKMSGTFGTAGFFSLGRGKNLTVYSGGIILTNDESLARETAGEIERLSDSGFVDDLAALIKLGAYALFLRPWLYWIPASSPFLGLGETVFDIGFDIGPMTGLQKSALRIVLPMLEDLNISRSKVAGRLARRIIRPGSRSIPGYSETNNPAYLRLPVIVSDKAERDNLIKDLRRINIVASAMYPSTIRRIPGIEKHLASDETEFPGARTVADRLICLPTHPYLRESDIEKIIRCFSKDAN